jgi:hypothetical protein
VKSGAFPNRDTTPIRAGETLNLDAGYLAKDVLLSTNRVEEGNFTLIAFVVKV